MNWFPFTEKELTLGIGYMLKIIAKQFWDILLKGEINETYLVGANCEKSNLQVVMSICEALGKNFTSSIKFVEDRSGHDYRYAIDPSKIQKELNWESKISFNKGLFLTLQYYAEKYNYKV